jgi:SulP family sulfate permease
MYYEVVVETIRNIPKSNPNALILAAITAVVVVVGPRISKKVPAALLGVVLAGGLAFMLGWHEAGPRKVDIVKDIEEISLDTLKLGKFQIPELIAHPNLELTREIGMGALALAILGLIEAASIARAIASQSGQRLDFTREFVAQGSGNVVGSFFLSFAGSGSFTRSAVCFKGGGRTRMAAIFSALWTALMVVALAPVANYIPKASLAGLLVVIAYTMIDKERLALTWKSGANSRLVLMGTLISTLVLPLEYAIFVGIFLSIVFLLRIIGQADLTQLVPGDEVGFEEVPFNRAPVSPVAVVNMEGDLYFAAVEDLDYELLRVIKPETRVIVLRMKRLRAVGSTAMAMLTHFWELLHSRGIHLVVCGIEEEMHTIMSNSGLQRDIGEQNIFYADNKLFQSTELAMARAWSIVKSGEADVAPPGEAAAESRSIMAGDLVSKRCIRFGASHPLREGVWLMSQLYQRSRLVETQTMFLQDKEGKLGAGLTTWDLLREMGRGLGAASGHRGLNATATALRSNFETRLDKIARSDVPHFTGRTPLNELVKTSIKDDLRVLPICDDEGRIIGVVSQGALIRGIGRMLGIEPDQEKGKENV